MTFIKIKVHSQAEKLVRGRHNKLWFARVRVPMRCVLLVWSGLFIHKQVFFQKREIEQGIAVRMLEESLQWTTLHCGSYMHGNHHQPQ